MMQKATVKQTKRVALGVALGSLVMLLVFFCLGKLTPPVWWGALLGAAVAIGDFVLLGLALQKAVTYESEPSRLLLMKANLNFRILLIAAAILAAYYAPIFNLVATVVPLAAGRITLYILRAWEAKHPTQEEEES